MAAKQVEKGLTDDITIVDKDADDVCLEHNFKILVIGEVDVGKTCLIRRYVQNIFTSNSKSTIGVDFSLKVIQWDEKTRLRVQLWDIAGQERFNHMTRVYYKEAMGAFIVFDATRGDSFEAVTRWKADLDSKTGLPLPDNLERPLPVILLANKMDLITNADTSNPRAPKWAASVTSDQLDDFCKEHNFLGWFETSAKDATYARNIDKAMRELAKEILEYLDKYGSNLTNNGIELGSAQLSASRCC
eukprot:TRINITY_DN1566_c0_g1_i1.p1 TRINITY_DN1566_c0_g1~~TRINITY_DN1566_c0_g1_i1.p1  ORF type:complete len:245 (-),score=53.53 TRINITY_DN1566_c0_g1_i1:115-849(-)